LSEREKPVKVFVHLGHGFGVTKWRQRYSAGLIPGINEPFPYGYYRAGKDSKWLIEYSEDTDESFLTQLFRRAMLRFVGFDLIHAWRNRNRLQDADVIWTHTEREHLALLLLWHISKGEPRPAIIAQCVWLFDLWTKLPRWKQLLYLRLLQTADLVTTQSPDNLAIARLLLRHVDCQSVRFGVGSGIPMMLGRRSIEKPIKLLTLGNDMHRDWQTLIESFGGSSDYQVRLASASAARWLVKGYRNVSLQPARTARELTDLYQKADLVVIPLKANSHASGITVILEATLFGLPVVCSDTGGLRAYFGDEHVRFVPVGNAAAMRQAVDEIAAKDELRKGLVKRAQERILSAGFTAQGFADQHRRLSEKLLAKSTGERAELHHNPALPNHDRREIAG
jgi:glycosyltransferase involved in cell wall biosynthesis